MQELIDGLLAYFRSNGQRVDKHTHRIVYAQVGAAIADGRDA